MAERIGGPGARGLGIDWTIVIPVKGTPLAKSRLAASAAVAEAIALDTVDAATAVGRVIVVTPASNPAPFDEAGALRVDDDGEGLAAAISAGIARAGGGAVAVLLGDVPALRPAELRSALEAAANYERALVADAAGTGTVLVTALAGVSHSPAFGGGSRARHLAGGYVELPVDASSGLRHDVDVPGDLERLRPRLGRRTTAALGGVGAAGTASARIDG